MTDLGTLGGRSQAWALNDVAQVIGSSWTDGTPDPNHPTVEHAFLWDDGVMADLGTLDGDYHSRALALNNHGQVVGTSWRFADTVRAVLWRPLQPEEVLEAVQAELDVLAAAGDIPAGTVAGLTNFIKVATAMLNDGNVTAAVRQLEAFVTAVDRLVNGGTLDAANGRALQAPANSAIGQLG